MVSSRVTVLYEDQDNSTGAKPFGLHELVKALVADELGQSIHDVKVRIIGLPLKGNARVLQGLRDTETIGRGSWVLAVLDEDRIRSQPEVNINLHEAEPQVVARVLDVSGTAKLRGVTLLVRNMETVVQAAAACYPALDQGIVQRALRKKLNERDMVLNSVAHGAPPAVRQCLMTKVPSLQDLRDRIICGLQNPHGW